MMEWDQECSNSNVFNKCNIKQQQMNLVRSLSLFLSLFLENSLAYPIWRKSWLLLPLLPADALDILFASIGFANAVSQTTKIKYNKLDVFFFWSSNAFPLEPHAVLFLSHSRARSCFSYLVSPFFIFNSFVIIYLILSIFILSRSIKLDVFIWLLPKSQHWSTQNNQRNFKRQFSWLGHNF